MEAKTTEIAIIRHPETLANVEARFVGRGDSPISENGREQMMALTLTMDAWNPTVVFSSPLKRTFVTAHAIVACGIPVNVLEDLQEIDFGLAEGLTYGELASLGMKVDYLRNGTGGRALPVEDREGPGDGPVAPGGEAWTDFEARVRRAAGVIEAGGSRIAVVTHGGVFRTLLAHWMGLPMEASWRFAVPNAAVATLTVTDGAGVLRSLQPAMV